MTDEPEQTPFGRLLLACGFNEADQVMAREGAIIDAHGAVLIRYHDEFVQPVRYSVEEMRRDALARDIADLGEAARAKMAARLARETALDRDQACGLAAALHHLGKGVDWFVRMIPATGTQTAARGIMTFVHHQRADLAMLRARERTALMAAMMNVMIHMDDDRIDVSLPPTAGELPGVCDLSFDPPLREIEPHQPAYMRHDPTKQHRRRKRR